MSIAIESGVKIPEFVDGRGRKEKYPFSELEVGDSFFVPDSTFESETALKRLRSTVSSANSRFKGERKFIVRGEDDGARVWRVEIE